MWCNLITIKIKNSHIIQVMVFLNDSLENKEQVRIQSMVNEYYLIEDIDFENRDAAYEFIKHCPKAFVKDFIFRKYIYTTGETL